MIAVETLVPQSTQAPAGDSSSDAPIATDIYNVTVVEYIEKDKEGKTQRDVLTDTEKAGKLVSEGKAKIVFEQAFKIGKAKTVEGINLLCPSDENKVYFFNGTATARQKNKANSQVLETDEQGNLTWVTTEEPVDMSPVLNEEISRRNLSPLEKAMKQLDGLPDAVKKVLIEKLSQQVASQ